MNCSPRSNLYSNNSSISGCAHLAGYDHESPEDEAAMRAVEVRLLAAAGLEGVYPE